MVGLVTLVTVSGHLTRSSRCSARRRVQEASAHIQLREGTQTWTVSSEERPHPAGFSSEFWGAWTSLTRMKMCRKVKVTGQTGRFPPHTQVSGFSLLPLFSLKPLFLVKPPRSPRWEEATKHFHFHSLEWM